MNPPAPSPDPSAHPAPAPAPPSTGRWLRPAAAVAAFLVFLVAGLFRPPREADLPPEVAALFTELQPRLADINVVFIGSSYTGYHVRPDLVAEAAAERGLELHPAVLALPGMGSFEADAVLDRLLALSPPNLQWVAMEYSRWDPELSLAQFKTSRAVWWQGPRLTGRFARTALAHARDDGDTDDAFAPIARAGLYLALNYSRIGRRSAAPGVLNQDEREARFAAWAARQAHPGFEAEYLKDLRRHLERIEDDGGWSSATAGRYTRLSAELFADQVARIRAAGAEPVYVLPPSMIKRSVRPEAPLLDFDRPEAFPDLFRPQDRIDSGHLSEDAAQRYSRRLGHAFADAVTSGTLPAPPGSWPRGLP